MMPYGERWKIHRKLCHEALNVRPTVDFDSHQYKYTHRLLAHLLEAPDRFMEEAALLVVSPPSSFRTNDVPMHHLLPEACPEPSYCP